MNVLFVSQCSKRALTETRRILDQFAERRGDRSWQTPITQQGLQTVHRMLRKTARKNTAVACHWIRGRNQTDLLWIVGDQRQFNEVGGTPTNTTSRDVRRSGDENDWHHAEDIRLLAQLAALFHDVGKANDAFQKKLTSTQYLADAYRHEWVSLRMFQAFVGADTQDKDWLQRLATVAGDQGPKLFPAPHRDGKDGQNSPPPLQHLPPLAQVVGWLIVSHHRMPVAPDASRKPTRTKSLQVVERLIQPDWCGSAREPEQKQIQACWRFSKGVPFASESWRKRTARIAQALLNRSGWVDAPDLDDPYMLHLSRLALMLADHHYSSLKSEPTLGDKGFPLYANTKDGQLNQRLDEHLLGVERAAGAFVARLPDIERRLPRIARHKGFRQRSKDSRFRWQDRAFDLASSLQSRSARQGFFGVNMASTGLGKTLANGRILYALGDPGLGVRFNIALGLRTLTLQTGDAYRDRLHLGSEDMAVLVGGGGVRALHEHQRTADQPQDQAPSAWEQAGSESAEALLSEQDFVHFEGSLEDGPLKKWLGNNPQAERLLQAPILVCTIDHLMPAVEGIRGGRQIAPMLRLMTSDLVLDEPDEFGLEDLPALTRLVNWCGMLGSRVLLSSATLPPALVEGLFNAYRAGRSIFQAHRGEPGLPLDICCAWFDEFDAKHGNHQEREGFRTQHDAFVERRIKQLAKAEQRRRAVIQPLPIQGNRPREDFCRDLAATLREQILSLHGQHAGEDPKTGKRASIGLVRMANIDPLVETARALHALGAPEQTRLHLCVYHSQHPLLVRAGIERRLDRLLNRKNPAALFDDIDMRAWLDQHPEPDQIFVVIATAVAEVGRDHDYDWAVVEPSSMRSIIQLAGRVRRHRPGPCDQPNIYLLDTNLRHLENGIGEPAFRWPGFESEDLKLDSHQLTDLLTDAQLSRTDATARIQERSPLTPSANLVDLEHAALRACMLDDEQFPMLTTPVDRWWTTRAHLTGLLQHKQRFRNDPEGRQRYGLLPDADGKIEFRRFERDGSTTGVEALRHEIDLEAAAGPRVTFWGEPEYEDALAALAEDLGMDNAQCAKRFGVLDLPAKRAEQGWWYHPALGFSRQK